MILYPVPPPPFNSCFFDVFFRETDLFDIQKNAAFEINAAGKYVSISQGLSAKSYWLGNFLAHIVLLSPTAVEFVTGWW